MANIRVLRGLRRWLTPPGSRAPLDSSYRQPNITGDDTNLSSPMAQHGKWPRLDHMRIVGVVRGLGR